MTECGKYRRMGGRRALLIAFLMETITDNQRNQKCNVRTQVYRPHPSLCLLPKIQEKVSHFLLTIWGLHVSPKVKTSSWFISGLTLSILWRISNSQHWILLRILMGTCPLC